MRSSALLAAILALVAAGWILSGQIGGGAGGNSQTAALQATNAAETEAAPVLQVRVATLTARARENRIRVTARTVAARRVELRAETEGQVVELLTRRGETVAEGQPIARLAMADRQAKLAEAKATLRQREIEFAAARKLHEKGFRSTTEQAGAEARLDAARAVVEQIEVDIARTTIRAPFEGIVGAGHIEKGDYLRVGDTVASIVDLSPILVVGNVTERHVGQVAEGMTGQAALVDGTRLAGTVRFVATVADPQTRTYRIELEAENTERRVRDGITAELVVPVGATHAHFVTPSTLTLDDAGAVGVKTVDAGNLVRFHPVEVLASESDGMWVAGLPDEIRLITVGQEFVVDGEKVDPVESSPAIAGPDAT